MLRLTKKADYSLIALRHFAVRRAESGVNAAVSAKEVADNCGISLPLLSKLLQKLGKSGFLTAAHGTNGGYRLARDPGLISALEVVRAIDGPIVLANCFTAETACGHASLCTVKRPLRRIHDGILRLLGEVSIEDLLTEEDALPPVDPSPGCSTTAPQKLVQLDASPVDDKIAPVGIRTI